MLQIQKHIDDVLSKDPALVGYDTAKYIFTDITFGVANEHRFIVERYSVLLLVLLVMTSKYDGHTTKMILMITISPLK